MTEFERKTAFGRAKLQELLWYEAKKEELPDGWVLTLPWRFFGEDGELPIYFKIGKKSDLCEISDGGVVMRAMRKKLGDLTPYMDRINKIIYDSGMHELRGGVTLFHEYGAGSVYDHIGRFSLFTYMVAALTNLDIAPPYTEDAQTRYYKYFCEREGIKYE